MSGALTGLNGSGAPSGLVVTLNPTTMSGFSTNHLPFTVQTFESVTAVIRGGRPPYSGTWTRVSGDTSITPTLGAEPTTGFSRFCTTVGDFSAVFKFTVTDAVSATADSNTVTVSLTANDLN